MVCDAKYKQSTFTPHKHLQETETTTTPTEMEAPNQPQQQQPQSEYREAGPGAQPSETWSYTSADNYGSSNTTPTPAPSAYVPEIIPESLLKRQQEAPRKSVDEMNKEELRAYTEQCLRESKEASEQSREKRRRAEYVLDIAKDKHVAIDPELEGKIRLPTISAKSKLSGPSYFSEALRVWAGEILHLAEKAEKYKPPEALDRQLLELIKLEIELLEPYLDEKWRKDHLSWFKIMIDEAAYGKHAAASENPTILDAGIEAEVTREQVGDKRERQHRLALRVIAQYPRWKAFHAWYANTAEKAIGERKENLHDTLSDSA